METALVRVLLLPNALPDGVSGWRQLLQAAGERLAQVQTSLIHIVGFCKDSCPKLNTAKALWHLHAHAACLAGSDRCWLHIAGTGRQRKCHSKCGGACEGRGAAAATAGGDEASGAGVGAGVDLPRGPPDAPLASRASVSALATPASNCCGHLSAGHAWCGPSARTVFFGAVLGDSSFRVTP